jgi:acyl carrier protein
MTTDHVFALIVETVRSLSLKGNFPRELISRPLEKETAITELGIDSLGKLSLISEIEDKAETMLGEGDLPGIKTLGDLAEVVVRSRALTARNGG